MTTEMRIYLEVRRRGKMTASMVAQLMGLSHMQAMKALRCLYDDGGLEREKAPHAGGLGRAPYRYWVDPRKKLCANGCGCELCVPNIVGRASRGQDNGHRHTVDR